jgi:hypothetical protein
LGNIFIIYLFLGFSLDEEIPVEKFKEAIYNGTTD